MVILVATGQKISRTAEMERDNRIILKVPNDLLFHSTISYLDQKLMKLCYIRGRKLTN